MPCKHRHSLQTWPHYSDIKVVTSPASLNCAQSECYCGRSHPMRYWNLHKGSNHHSEWICKGVQQCFLPMNQGMLFLPIFSRIFASPLRSSLCFRWMFRNPKLLFDWVRLQVWLPFSLSLQVKSLCETISSHFSQLGLAFFQLQFFQHKSKGSQDVHRHCTPRVQEVLHDRRVWSIGTHMHPLLCGSLWAWMHSENDSKTGEATPGGRQHWALGTKTPGDSQYSATWATLICACSINRLVICCFMLELCFEYPMLVTCRTSRKKQMSTRWQLAQPTQKSLWGTAHSTSHIRTGHRFPSLYALLACIVWPEQWIEVTMVAKLLNSTDSLICGIQMDFHECGDTKLHMNVLQALFWASIQHFGWSASWGFH